MMPCKACKTAHSPLLPCSVARRLAATAAAKALVANAGLVANELVANKVDSVPMVANGQEMVANGHAMAVAGAELVANAAPPTTMVANAVVAQSRHGAYADEARRRIYMANYMRAYRARKPSR